MTKKDPSGPLDTAVRLGEALMRGDNDTVMALAGEVDLRGKGAQPRGKE